MRTLAEAIQLAVIDPTYARGAGELRAGVTQRRRLNHVNGHVGKLAVALSDAQLGDGDGGRQFVVVIDPRSSRPL